MKTKRNTYLLALIILVLLSNCKQQNETQYDQSDSIDTETSSALENDTESEVNVAEAIAILNGASGSTISGKATFTQVDNASVTIDLNISNATPGNHAVHLHENGDCSAADGASAGGHWNPTDTQHGKRGSDEFHKGDIANMVVDEGGSGSLVMTIRGWTIGGATESDILNKAVIIHDGADDFTSQPSGAAGNRVACGVIEKM